MNLSQRIIDYLQELTKDAFQGYELQLGIVVKKLSINYFDADFNEDENISGMIKKNDHTNEYEIFINRRHPRSRKRFTLAHEIGHFISYKFDSYSKEELEKEESLADYAISYRKDGHFSKAEAEANLIAATLLMPEDKIKKILNEGLTIEQMAEKFYVSPSSMTIRLQYLYPDLMVI